MSCLIQHGVLKKVSAIHVSDWSISKKSSPLKLLSHMNRNLIGSIYKYGRFCIKFPQSKMKGELTDQDKMSNLHRGHSIDASYQVSVVAMFANRLGRNEQPS
jgi:hypothetical protein